MRSLSGAASAFVAMLALGSFTSLVGCAKVGDLKAMKASKAANAAYPKGDMLSSIGRHEEAIQASPDSRQGHQSLFYLGNSYDNLYKPSKKGEAENDALLMKAVQNYQKAAETLSASPEPDDKKLGKLSLQYLVASYGPDKLNDPAKAEPVVQKMIQLEPTEPTNYFQLAKIYEDAGAYEEAEKMLVKAKEAKPSEPAVYTTLAGYYNRQGQFDKTMQALAERAAKEPNNPEAFHMMATYYWDEAYRDFKLKDAEKKEYIAKGLEAVDRAIQLKPDYMEALVYKGLLLRSQALLEKDPAKQAALIKQAEELSKKANDLRKAKAAGTTP